MKKILTWLIVLSMVLILNPITAYSANKLFDQIGFNLHIGEETFVSSWQSKKYNFTAFSFELTAGRYLNKKKNWLLEISGLYNQQQAEYISTSKTSYAFGSEIGIAYEFKKIFQPAIFYIGFRAGLLYLLNSKNQPDLGNSNLIGTFGPNIGVKIPILNNCYLNAGVALKHYSNPFKNGDDGDKGRNLHYFFIGIIW